MSPVVRRALALAILVAALAFLAFGVVLPMLDDYRRTEDSIAEMSDRLDRYRRAASDVGATEAELKRLEAGGTAEDGFLEGASDALAAASLQDRIKTLVERARGELRSTQPLPGRDDGKFRRVTVRSQMAGDLAAVQRIVHGLESGYPLLFVDTLTIRSRGRSRGEDGERAPVLDTGFEVSGLMAAAK